MAKKVNDLCVANGKYTDSQNNEKTQYENIGVEMENDDGSRFILLKACINLSGFDRQGKMIVVSKFSVTSSLQTHQSSVIAPVQAPVITKDEYPVAETNITSQEIDTSSVSKNLDLF